MLDRLPFPRFYVPLSHPEKTSRMALGRLRPAMEQSVTLETRRRILAILTFRLALIALGFIALISSMLTPFQPGWSTESMVMTGLPIMAVVAAHGRWKDMFAAGPAFADTRLYYALVAALMIWTLLAPSGQMRGALLATLSALLLPAVVGGVRGLKDPATHAERRRILRFLASRPAAERRQLQSDITTAYELG